MVLVLVFAVVVLILAFSFVLFWFALLVGKIFDILKLKTDVQEDWEVTQWIKNLLQRA